MPSSVETRWPRGFRGQMKRRCETPATWTCSCVGPTCPRFNTAGWRRSDAVGRWTFSWTVPTASRVGDAVHIVFAGECARPDQPEPNADIEFYGAISFQSPHRSATASVPRVTPSRARTFSRAMTSTVSVPPWRRSPLSRITGSAVARFSSSNSTRKLLAPAARNPRTNSASLWARALKTALRDSPPQLGPGTRHRRGRAAWLRAGRRAGRR